MKKLVRFILIFTLLLSSTTIFTQAKSIENVATIGYETKMTEEEINAHRSQNCGISVNVPNDYENIILPSSVRIPTEVWDISSKGQYDFSGTSNYQDLYTDYKFIGKTSYSVVVKNYSDYDLIVKAKTLLKTYDTVTVTPGYTYYFFPDIGDPKKEIYLLFQGNDTDFAGYIY